MALIIGFIVIVALILIFSVSSCLEENCNVSSDNSFELAILILVRICMAIYLIALACSNSKTNEKKNEHMENFKKHGISTQRCVFSQYGCTIYKDINKLAYSQLGATVPGIADTGYFSINKSTKVCVIYRTGYSSRIQSKHDMTLGALAGLFDVGVILDANPDDNCIKSIWAEYNTDGIINRIPIFCGEIEIDSTTQNKLSDIDAKIQSTLR